MSSRPLIFGSFEFFFVNMIVCLHVLYDSDVIIKAFISNSDQTFFILPFKCKNLFVDLYFRHSYGRELGLVAAIR